MLRAHQSGRPRPRPATLLAFLCGTIAASRRQTHSFRTSQTTPLVRHLCVTSCAVLAALRCLVADSGHTGGLVDRYRTSVRLLRVGWLPVDFFSKATPLASPGRACSSFWECESDSEQMSRMTSASQLEALLASCAPGKHPHKVTMCIDTHVDVQTWV